MRSNAKGFTMLEIMIATGISSLMIMAFMAAFGAMRNQMYIEDNYYVTDRGPYYALDVINRDAQESYSVLSSATVNGTSYTTGSHVLVLELPSINSSGQAIDITSAYDYVAYSVDTNNPPNLIRNLQINAAGAGGSQRNAASNSTNRIVARKLANSSSFSLSSWQDKTGTSVGSTYSSAATFNVSISTQGSIGSLSGITQSISADTNVTLRDK